MAASNWTWANGQLIPGGDVTVPVAASALHFGPVAFEGIRAYVLADRTLNFFRLRDHVTRLRGSAHALNLDVPFSPDALADACSRTVIANGHSEAYVRVLAFPSSGTLGFGRHHEAPADTYVLSFPWHNAHLIKSQGRGIRLHVSSVIRADPHPAISRSKLSANYAAGLLAIDQARRAGCDDALLLEINGSVAEATTANVFAVWGERVVTPPTSLPILPGITRDALLVLARDIGLQPCEETFTVADLQSADEVFLSGTTAEVTPVREIDGRAVGPSAPGPVTTRLLRALHAAIRAGSTDRYGWSHLAAV